MAGGELKVDPSDLYSKATMIEGIPWGDDPTAATVGDPDALSATTASVRNLVKNAQALGAEQKWGIAESRRLAETLRLVGKAYEDIDEASRHNIDASMPGGTASPATTPVPVGINAAPVPPVPPPMPSFEDVPADGDILDPIETDEKLHGGDQASTLRSAAAEWTAAAGRLTQAALPFEIRMQNWEGVAAEAAYTKFKAFGGWLQALGGKWTQLAAEAEKLATAHDQAKAANAPVRAEYEALRTQLLSGQTDGGAARAIQLKMEALYQESESIREAYANGGRPTPVQPPQPRPTSNAPSSTVTGNGDPNARGVPARSEDEERRGPSASGGGAPGERSGGGGQPQTPQQAPVSAASATDPAAQAAQQAGPQGGQQGSQQGGGQQGGGSPGGGSPGGAPGGGAPGSGKGTDPKLPTGPALKPAAAGGGSAGGGGGGGGAPSSPLQPAVGAETVAPSPARVGAPVPVASAGAGGAMMGGGMGGMAPMHGAQAGGAGEKKRNPQLSTDEPLYVEDRPHTEQVIGVRPRRRGNPDDTRRGDAQ